MKELSAENLRNGLLCSELSEAKLLEYIHELSSTFTTERSQIEKYGLSKEQVSAYSYFYFPTNLPKLTYLLQKLPKEIVSELSKCVLIDYGTGPGTFAQAWAAFFDLESQKIIAFDQSALMVEQARKLWECMGQVANLAHFETETRDILSIVEKRCSSHLKKVLLFGHSLNEIGPLKALELIFKLNPEFVIFIEPGTKKVFSEILTARSALIQRGYSNIFPCPSNANCPMENVDWCHQIMLSVHHESIERICQKLKMDRRVQPLIAHVYKKGETISAQEGPMIVRSFPPTKASIRFMTCEKNVENAQVEVEFLMRDLTKTQMKMLDKKRSGDTLSYIVKDQITPHKLRAKVKKSEDPDGSE